MFYFGEPPMPKYVRSWIERLTRSLLWVPTPRFSYAAPCPWHDWNVNTLNENCNTLALELLAALVVVCALSTSATADMTVSEYERLRSSARQEDRTSVQLYVQGVFNGLLWASTKAAKELGLGLVCDSDKITTPEQLFLIIDREIQRKRFGNDVKPLLPLPLVISEGLYRQFPCQPTPPKIAGTLMQGARLAQYCNSDNDLSLKGICVGFVTAIADILNFVPLYGRRACPPPTFKLQDGVTTVQKWINAHPNDSKYDAREIVVVALSDAYRCSVRPGK
jgi:Rap1a immunity proteins